MHRLDLEYLDLFQMVIVCLSYVDLLLVQQSVQCSRKSVRVYRTKSDKFDLSNKCQEMSRTCFSVILSLYFT